jgi:hypothetical protein
MLLRHTHSHKIISYAVIRQLLYLSASSPHTHTVRRKTETYRWLIFSGNRVCVCVCVCQGTCLPVDVGLLLTEIFSPHRNVPLVRSRVSELVRRCSQWILGVQQSGVQLGFIIVWKEHILSKVRDKSYPKKDTWDKAYRQALDCHKQYNSSAIKDSVRSKVNLWNAFHKGFFL